MAVTSHRPQLRYQSMYMSWLRLCVDVSVHVHVHIRQLGGDCYSNIGNHYSWETQSIRMLKLSLSQYFQRLFLVKISYTVLHLKSPQLCPAQAVERENLQCYRPQQNQGTNKWCLLWYSVVMCELCSQREGVS